MRKKRKRVTGERVGGKGARGTVQSGSIRKPPGQGRRSSWKEREKAGEVSREDEKSEKAWRGETMRGWKGEGSGTLYLEKCHR